MLPKPFRLTKKDKIQYIVNRDSVLLNPFLIIKRRPNQGTNDRFCIIISRKFHLEAVTRNKLRRQIYEVIRHHLNLLSNQPQHFDWAIVVRKPLLNISYHEIKKNIIKALNLGTRY